MDTCSPNRWRGRHEPLGAILLVWRNLHQDIASLGKRISSVEQRIARIEGWLDGWRTPFPQIERQSSAG